MAQEELDIVNRTVITTTTTTNCFYLIVIKISPLEKAQAHMTSLVDFSKLPEIRGKKECFLAHRMKLA